MGQQQRQVIKVTITLDSAFTISIGDVRHILFDCTLCQERFKKGCNLYDESFSQ